MSERNESTHAADRPGGDSPSRAVLITGCSSGTGRATAERLAGAGWRVYATARRAESVEDLARRGCETLALDVTDEASMRAAVAAVEKAEGAVGVLVNNAGYSQSGGVYEGPLARLGGGPETVAKTIERAISARRPKTRYKVTPSAHLVVAQRRLLTDRAWDRLLRSQFPSPGS